MEKKQDKKKEPERFIRFDWAAKRLLRDKANFGVLEGLLTVLLGDGEHPVHIVEILESESNQLHMKDKFNRVDIKARNAEGEIILVEIQSNWELYFIERLLFGVAKAITEHIDLGESYGKVKKVYSICILYFSLGQGADYLYHGQTTFVGVHTGDELRISEKEKKALVPRLPSEIFPEYYLIRVDEFNKVATTPLEEWIEFLKTEKIRPDTTTPGLQEARRKMNFYSLSKAEQEA
ncbi:MAG: Rpn family recombination-promoting nuclease/putative transposase, partial [Tannerella sp.]|nr:Rpn family recombination-promoting nuclease/putative transposase [Tannerella sp.]